MGAIPLPPPTNKTLSALPGKVNPFPNGKTKLRILPRPISVSFFEPFPSIFTINEIVFSL